jgi:hypothetical protein
MQELLELRRFKMYFKRKGELREATESLIVSIEVEISKTQDYLVSLQKERTSLKGKLEQQD